MASWRKHPTFSVTVDLAIFAITTDVLRVLLVRREREPMRGRLALPGSFLGPDEDVPVAAQRVLLEQDARSVVLEPVGTYGAPGRDPRGRVVSVAFLAVVAGRAETRFTSDAAVAEWHSVQPLLRGRDRLAFDHRRILRDALEQVRFELEHTTLATAFVGREFTLSELRNVYEVVWGAEFDAGNFQRKMRQTEDFVVETGRTRPSPARRGRPAATFRARRRTVHRLSAPITRAG